MAANTFYKKENASSLTTHEQSSVRTLQRCRSDGDHEAVIARIEIPTNHKIQQILRPTNKKATTNTTKAVATNSTGTSTRYLNDKLENVMTGSATYTQEEQPHDNTITNNDHGESLRRLIQKHNTTQNEDRQTKKTQAR